MNGSGNREQRSGLLDYLKRAAILRKSKGWQQTIEAARLDQMEILDKIFHLKQFILKESVITAPHQTPERPAVKFFGGRGRGNGICRNQVTE